MFARFRFLSSLLGLTLLSLSLAAADSVTLKIGSYGAEAQVSGDWKAEMFTEDVGGQQFHMQKKVLVLVFELFEPVTSEEAFKPYVERMEAMGSGGNKIKKYSFEERDGVFYGTLSTTTDVGGTKLTYRVDTISAHGLTYNFTAWSLPADKRQLFKEMSNLVENFNFPDASKIPAANEQVKEEIKTAAADLVVSFSPRAYTNVTDPEGSVLLHLISGDQGHQVFFVINEWLWEDDPDAFAKAFIDAIGAGDVSYVDEGVRVPMGGEMGYLFSFKADLGEGPLMFYQAVHPINDNDLLAIRVLTEEVNSKANWEKVKQLLADLEIKPKR